MRRTLAAFIILLAGCRSTPIEDPPGEIPDTADAQLDDDALAARDACLQGQGVDPYRAQACEMLDLINADRAMLAEESGWAGSVDWNEELAMVAQYHSADMCARGFFSHENPDGERAAERAARLGFDYDDVGENILRWPEVAAGHHVMMNEPTCMGHRGLILDAQVISVGIGVIECDGELVLTQNYELDFSLPNAAFCEDPTMSCRRPHAPVSSAECGDWCESTQDIDLEHWGC